MRNKIPPFPSVGLRVIPTSCLPYPSNHYSCCNMSRSRGICHPSSHFELFHAHQRTLTPAATYSASHFRYLPCPSLIKPLLLLRQHNLGLESWKDLPSICPSFQALSCPLKPYSCCANISMSVGICHPCARQARLKASIASPTE